MLKSRPREARHPMRMSPPPMIRTTTARIPTTPTNCAAFMLVEPNPARCAALRPKRLELKYALFCLIAPIASTSKDLPAEESNCHGTKDRELFREGAPSNGVEGEQTHQHEYDDPKGAVHKEPAVGPRSTRDGGPFQIE